ncbi:hypothetical protein GWI33_017555 [Rhynchophorus ferrugineus]|uniref:Uncharacterized protein n=1 Tax=Rhynchophorus ferrugineus TaxID=354439 RepID=A0A834HVR7_RHYFE|nr:hypothetical protein GWI33_017555 [Rhynchophorus ferrugineus]
MPTILVSQHVRKQKKTERIYQIDIDKRSDRYDRHSLRWSGAYRDPRPYHSGGSSTRDPYLAAEINQKRNLRQIPLKEKEKDEYHGISRKRATPCTFQGRISFKLMNNLENGPDVVTFQRR